MTKRIRPIVTGTDEKFDDLTRQAARGNVKPLYDRLATKPPTPAEARAIAGLLHNKLQHGKRGRPHASKSATPVGAHTQNLYDATDEYIAGKRKWCADNDGVRCPPIVSEAIFDEIAKRRGLSAKDRQYVKDRAKRGSHKQLRAISPAS